MMRSPSTAALASVLVAAALAFPAASAQGAPTSITFTIPHADCGETGAAGYGRFRFFLNDALIAERPTTRPCLPSGEPPAQYVFTEPEILAAFDPAGCNAFRVEGVTTAERWIAVGFVRVAVEQGGVSEERCLYDSVPLSRPFLECRGTPCGFGFCGEDFSTTVVDFDSDGRAAGIGPGCDLCTVAFDPLQEDEDGDGQGDFCDTCFGAGFHDIDRDGVCTPQDNCRSTANPDQTDTDGDGIGDACDFCDGEGTLDHDQDGVCSEHDNCIFLPNQDQVDADGDGIGDACDVCPAVVDVYQSDEDFDGIGDACDDLFCFDEDFDGFGSVNWPSNECATDNCDEDFNPGQADEDQDGHGDVCDFCPGPGRTNGDGDPLCDEFDNCEEENPGQEDADGDGVGDLCDVCVGPGAVDFDDDGTCEAADNCPFLFNPAQEDGDGDGRGDPCDNCPAISNPSPSQSGFQPDDDQDGLGNQCDPVFCLDRDGDGFGDRHHAANQCPTDNCPSRFNPDQADGDGDGVGNECDNCPDAANAAQLDFDNDELGDACDATRCVDDDGDGFGHPNVDYDLCPPDNCWIDVNPDQSDRNGDGVGDACDPCPDDTAPEPDADGVCNAVDNCPDRPNPDQSDLDGDGLGDACDPCTDPDRDGTHAPGIPNPFPNACPRDNCPGVANADQRDLDGDFVGDACDATDGTLVLTRARVWAPDARAGSRRPRGTIRVRGTLTLGSPPDAFATTNGLALRVRDGRALDESFTFTPAECRTRPSGVIRCRSAADGRVAAKLHPRQRSGGREIAFDVSFRGLDIARPFAPPLTVTLTERPGVPTRGTDRIGTIATCTFTGGVPCGRPGSPNAAFLAEPGETLLDR